MLAMTYVLHFVRCCPVLSRVSACSVRQRLEDSIWQMWDQITSMILEIGMPIQAIVVQFHC